MFQNRLMSYRIGSATIVSLGMAGRKHTHKNNESYTISPSCPDGWGERVPLVLPLVSSTLYSAKVRETVSV